MCKVCKKTIVIPKLKAAYFNKILANQQGHELGEDETITYTARFDNGIEMDIKICGVHFKENEDNTPWTEAVLFDHGCEVCCTEPSDSFFGEWELEIDGTVYKVLVTPEE